MRDELVLVINEASEPMIHCDEDSSPEALGPLFKGSKELVLCSEVCSYACIPTRDKKKDKLTFSIGRALC